MVTTVVSIFQVMKGFGDLQPDVAAAHHHGPLNSGGDERPQPSRIVQGSEYVDALQMHALDRRSNSSSAGGV